MKSHGTAVLEVCDLVFPPFSKALCGRHAVNGHMGFNLEMPQNCNVFIQSCWGYSALALWKPQELVALTSPRGIPSEGSPGAQCPLVRIPG